jgi:hypothetical protein
MRAPICLSEPAACGSTRSIRTTLPAASTTSRGWSAGGAILGRREACGRYDALPDAWGAKHDSRERKAHQQLSALEEQLAYRQQELCVS